MLSDFETQFHVMTRSGSPDSEGGSASTWTEGAAISLALYENQSMEAMKAMKQGVTSVFTALVPVGSLSYDTYIRRDSDDAVFRVTSRPVDYQTPRIASFQRQKITLERTELPS